MKSLLILTVLVYSSSAFFFSYNTNSDKWTGLKARFGLNPFSSTAFAPLPRTVTEAVERGWKLDISGGGCGITGTKFNGNRYTKDNDPATMVLFDKNGYVAGIQAGIPKTSSNYPGPQNAKYHVFNEEAEMWVITAYFVEPSTICTVGRTAEEFETQGTGTTLSFQTGEDASSLMEIPAEEDQVMKTTKFMDGKCFYLMGNHYWYDARDDQGKTSCDDTFPAFLLYNGGKLNAFGWIFNLDYRTSERWEHPVRSSFGNFMTNVPDCLGVDGPITTLHVYLTDSPSRNYC